jgi:hypothetical protein
MKAEETMPKKRTCATMDVHRRLLTESEDYRNNLSQIENDTLEYMKRPRSTLRGIIQIPVVVHVVWNTNPQNISQNQIQSQIDVLNRDFQRTNPDISGVPSVWTNLIGNAQLQFNLATRDPNNNPTNGIVRRQTTVTQFGSNDAVKFNSSGGSDAWDTTRYLNIWVCNLGSSLLGYAQFPGGPANTDGVVVTHSGFGTTGTATAPFNLGRTATHEVGHWFNLRHIWGDDGTGCTGTDNVDDTPNQGGPNYGCPNFPKTSCNNGPNGDMFMNYMDYVDDGCMIMFTNGQVSRIDACLAGPRKSLINTLI